MADRSLKQQAAEAAAQLVQPGMRLGLGSGSTVDLIVAALGERARRGELADLRIVVASRWTKAAVEAAGMTLTALNDLPQLDLAIDGADEIDPQRRMIKGGGGALLRERIVLAAARRRLIVVDESKLTPVLGARWTVPVEVVQFGWRVAEAAIQALGGRPTLRMADAAPLLTDEGNLILDCAFGQIADPVGLSQALWAAPAVMDHGLFIDLCDQMLVATAGGVEQR
jgi:ribose 5-phosphate isomerase A